MVISFFRTVILYILLMLCIRLMGKREIGELEPMEFVVALLIADLASVPMQDLGMPLVCGVVPILTLFSLELICAALSLRSLRFRALLCGKPMVLMRDGVIQEDNLRKSRMSTDELIKCLRLKQVTDLSKVRYAILETNGELSVLLSPKDLPATAADACIQVKPLHLPVTVVSEGKILEKNLLLTGRNTDWLDRELKNRNCPTAEVFLLTVDESGKVYFQRKENGE